MGKLFTRLLSSLFVFCFFSISTIVFAQQPQKTVQLYAGDVSKCYSASNEYLVKISVRDFIQLVQFNLALKYETSVFNYKGFSLSGTLPGVNVTQGIGSVKLTWDNGIIPVTLGDGVVTDIVTLKFSIRNFPYNLASSYLSTLSWITHDFNYYDLSTGKISNNSFPVNGKLNVSVGVTNVQVAMTNVSCFDEDADIDVISPAEGTGYTYLFNEDPNPANWTWTTDAHSSAPTGSSNSIRVKDSNGCISLMKSFVVKTVTPVTYTAFPQDASCKGGNGEIQINVNGGTGPYTYWVVPKADFAKVQSTLNSVGKAAASLTKYKKTNFQILRPVGDYYVAVDDVNLCRDLTDIPYWSLLTIKQPDTALAIAISNLKGENCSGANDGSFDVTVSGGALPEYQVFIEGQNGTTVGGLYSFTGLTPGDYVVEAIDINGCNISSGTITIAPKAPITFTIGVEYATCGGVDNGSINVTNITNGVSPYKLTIVGGGTSTIKEDVIGGYQFTGLSSNYYSLTITDANNCTIDYSNPDNSGNVIALQSPDDIKYSLDIANPLCFDGNATVAVTGVTGGGGVGYLYSINGGTWQASNLFDISQPFDPDYTISVKNAMGADCSVIHPAFTVTAPSKLTASLGLVTAPSCFEGTTGKIEANITGGTPPYYCSVNNGPWMNVSDPVAIIDNLIVGNYSINIKDANGCMILAPLDGNVTQYKNIIIASAAKIDCFNEKITMEASWTSWADNGIGRVLQYKYASSPETLSTSGIGFTPGITEFGPGKYYIGAIDQFDCMSNVVEVDVEQNPELLITSVIANGATCYGTTKGKINIQATGGTVTGLLQYALLTDEDYSSIDESVWKNFDTYDSGSKLSTVSFDVIKGVYFISVRDNHCVNNQKNYGPVTVTSYDQLLVDEALISKVNVLCWNSSTGSISLPMNAVSGGAGTYLFTLLDGAGIAVAGKVDQSTGVFANLKAGKYSILVNDSQGCTPYTTAVITITESSELLFTATSQKATGFGIEDGTIKFTSVSGGNGIYTAVITGMGADGTTKTYTQSISDANGWTVSGVAASDDAGYDVKVLDGISCESSGTTVIATQPAKLVVTLTKGVDAFTCSDLVDGTIEATATGGEGAYTYSLYKDDILALGDVVQTSYLVSVGHSYKVVVTDENGNTANASLTVNPVLPVVLTVNDMTCGGELNPIAEIEVSGEPGRVFRLQYAAVVDGIEGAKSVIIPIVDSYSFIADLPYGSDGTVNYKFYVDDVLCAPIVVNKIFVKVDTQMNVTVDQLANEVNATITITGGVGPYDYTFGGVQGVANSGVSFVVNGIKTTSTDLTISDLHGCTIQKSLIANAISVTANPASGNNQPAQFDVVLTFNRLVTIAAGDIMGGTFTPGTGTSFTVSMTGAAYADLALNLGTGIKDAAGNTFEGKSFAYKVGDFITPKLIVTPPASPVAKTFTVGLKFSEPVTGVNNSNIQVTNGTLVSVTGSADIYTLTVSAAEQADVSIVLGNGIVDLSANANKFAGVTLRYKIGDFTAPTLVVTPPTTPAARNFTVGLKFSEPVNGVSLYSPAVKVTGGTLLNVIGNSDVYTLTISGNDLATVSIVLSNAITDKSINANKFIGTTLSYTIGDNTPPILVTMFPNSNTVLTDTHPAFSMNLSENVKLGTGGNLTVYKFLTTTPVLTIPITANMITGKAVVANFTGSNGVGLERSTKYYVLVDGSTLTDIAGNKFAGVKNADVWTFKTGTNWPTLIDAKSNVSEFKVYPNPFTDVIYLVASSPLSKVVVTNIVGQVVKEVVNPANNIELNELRSGIYFISLYDMDNVIAKTAKIVKK